MSMTKEQTEKAWGAFAAQQNAKSDDELRVLVASSEVRWGEIAKHFTARAFVAPTRLDVSLSESIMGSITLAFEFGAYVGRLERDEEAFRVVSTGAASH